jgi:glucokinase
MDGSVVGLDIGGSKILALRLSPGGTVAHRVSRATPAADGADAVMRAAFDIVREVVDSDRSGVNAIGVAVTGAVSPDGTIVASGKHMPGWLGTDVAAGFRNEFGSAVAVENDVRAWALHELEGSRPRNALYVVTGTGVGGAIVLDGRLTSGRHGTSGEIGHLLVDAADSARECPCGATGHLEAYASGPAIVLEYQRRVGTASPEDLLQLEFRAAAGDLVADACVREGAVTLGRALGGLVTALDLDDVLVAGGVLGVGARFCEPMVEAMRAAAHPQGRSTSVSLVFDHADRAAMFTARRAADSA